MKNRIYGNSDFSQLLNTRGDWERRFWPKIDKGENSAHCWEWTAGCNDKGYGVFATIATREERNLEYAHRLSWLLHTHEHIPFGFVIDHKCSNPKCCNPDHLQAIPIQENSAQHVRIQSKTHCGVCGEEKGVSENTGRTWCRPCQRVRSRRYKLKKKDSVV